MTRTAALAVLRRRHCVLEALPDTIVIPVADPFRREPVVMPIADATLDDIAFALIGVEAEFNAVGDRLHALHKLYDLAREAGKRGNEYAVDLGSWTEGER